MTWIERARRVCLALLIGCAASPCVRAADITPDAARETRWAEEVVPQVVIGDAVWLATRHRARVLALYATPAGDDAKGAVIVVHGLGVHPDWNLIGELRSALVDRGFATLSVQMPVLAADAPREQYAALAPLAGERLDAALAWLRARGHSRIAVASHSMGAGMVNAWLAAPGRPRIDAWVPIGMLVHFARAPRVPVLDVVAERDFPEVLELAPRRSGELPRDRCSKTVSIADADHYMTGRTTPLADAIVTFLDTVFARRC